MSESSQGSSVGVVLPAAGRGRRLGGRRKQVRTLGAEPVLVHTVRRFAGISDIEVIVVPTGADVIDEVEAALAEAEVSDQCIVVAGGESRQASVAAGLKAVPPAIGCILVHDAVRPFVSQQTIEEVILLVRREGAAAAAVPVADTVRRAEGGWFDELVDRQNLYRMQTPQGFRRDWIEEAHRKALQDAVTATDDVALVRRLGHPVRLVEGDARNIKITTPADWELAQILWRERSTK